MSYENVDLRAGLEKRIKTTDSRDARRWKMMKYRGLFISPVYICVHSRSSAVESLFLHVRDNC